MEREGSGSCSLWKLEGTRAEQLQEEAAGSRSLQGCNRGERRHAPYSRGPQRQSEGWWKQNWEWPGYSQCWVPREAPWGRGEV